MVSELVFWALRAILGFASFDCIETANLSAFTDNGVYVTAYRADQPIALMRLPEGTSGVPEHWLGGSLIMTQSCGDTEMGGGPSPLRFDFEPFVRGMTIEVTVGGNEGEYLPVLICYKPNGRAVMGDHAASSPLQPDFVFMQALTSPRFDVTISHCLLWADVEDNRGFFSRLAVEPRTATATFEISPYCGDCAYERQPTLPEWSDAKLASYGLNPDKYRLVPPRE